jgi:hypothetical protein
VLGYVWAAISLAASVLFLFALLTGAGTLLILLVALVQVIALVQAYGHLGDD